MIRATALVSALIAAAAPAGAHVGGHVLPHVHPHDGAAWLAVATLLGVAACAGGILGALHLRGRR